MPRDGRREPRPGRPISRGRSLAGFPLVTINLCDGRAVFWGMTREIDTPDSGSRDPRAQYVAVVVLDMAGLPSTAKVQFMTLVSTTMPCIGPG